MSNPETYSFPGAVYRHGKKNKECQQTLKKILKVDFSPNGQCRANCQNNCANPVCTTLQERCLHFFFDLHQGLPINCNPMLGGMSSFFLCSSYLDPDVVALGVIGEILRPPNDRVLDGLLGLLQIPLSAAEITHQASVVSPVLLGRSLCHVLMNIRAKGIEGRGLGIGQGRRGSGWTALLGRGEPRNVGR